MAIKPVHRLTGDHIAFPTATDGVPIGSTPDKGVDGPLCENGQVRWLHAEALCHQYGEVSAGAVTACHDARHVQPQVCRFCRDPAYRCPTWLLATGAVFGFVNMVWMGAGADVWGEGTLRNGLLAVLLIIPVFAYRHYVQDKGQFPISDGDGEGGVVQQAVQPKAGAFPYLALIVAAAMVGLSAYLAA